ncbi:MAG: MBL fold metallo-hydrolase [Chloroflexota bacterium]
MTKIHTIDLNFRGVPHTIAVYVIESRDGLVLVETGPASCLAALKSGLAEIGYQPSDVKHVLLTHIHFDHAGAAGWWASQGAHIYVHHIGAPHMIDPSRLNASAKRIYGDQMETLWGTLLPINPDQVTTLHNWGKIKIGKLTFECLDTPGHAKHHMAFKLGDVCFSGDVGGVRLVGRPLIDLPSAPPQFDQEAWLASVGCLKAFKFREIYPTHFGGIVGTGNVEAHLSELTRFIPTVSNLIKEQLEQGKTREEIIKFYEGWQTDRAELEGLVESELHAYFTATPPDVSVDGVIRYWKKRWESQHMGQ